MAKNKRFSPTIKSGLTPGDDNVIGGGTGQSTPDVYACDYDDWYTMFSSDVNGSGTIDFEDYRQWFIITFGDEAEELWELYNDEPLNP